MMRRTTTLFDTACMVKWQIRLAKSPLPPERGCVRAARVRCRTVKRGEGASSRGDATAVASPHGRSCDRRSLVVLLHLALGLLLIVVVIIALGLLDLEALQRLEDAVHLGFEGVEAAVGVR